MKLTMVVSQGCSEDTAYLCRYIRDCFGKDIDTKELTTMNLIKLTDYFKSIVSNNTALHYCSRIKAALGKFSDVAPIPGNIAKLTLKQEDSIHTFLTKDELRKLEALIPDTHGSDLMYLLYFLVSAYTGCRTSDALRMNTARAKNGKLIFVCQKTKRKAETVVNDKVISWIDTLQRIAPEYTYAKIDYNHAIKELCKRAGIDEVVATYRGGKEKVTPKWVVVSPHTARRSFATNLYLFGLDIFSISKMMAHSSTEMTARYICCGLKEIDDSVMNYFAD